MDFSNKRKDNNEWVYGYYLYSEKYNKHYIVDERITTTLDGKLIPNESGFIKREVIPETVCQYTGLNDETGKKIFENDIVFYSDFASVYKDDITGVVKYTQDCMFEIEYADKYVKGGKTTRPLVCHEYPTFTQKKTKVIGNKFDDGELIC